jgi:hypothetical protein
MSFIQYLKEMSIAVVKNVKDEKNRQYRLEIILLKGRNVDMSNVSHIIFENGLYQPSGKTKNGMYELKGLQGGLLWVDKNITSVEIKL